MQRSYIRYMHLFDTMREGAVCSCSQTVDVGMCLCACVYFVFVFYVLDRQQLEVSRLTSHLRPPAKTTHEE